MAPPPAKRKAVQSTKIEDFFNRKPVPVAVPKTRIKIEKEATAAPKKSPKEEIQEKAIHDTPIKVKAPNSPATSPVVPPPATSNSTPAVVTRTRSPDTESTLSTTYTDPPDDVESKASPLGEIDDSQNLDADLLLPSDSDDSDLPDFSSLFPSRMTRSVSNRSTRSLRSSTRKESPVSKSAPLTRRPSPSATRKKVSATDFSFAQLLKESEEIKKRQAERARLAAVLKEDVDHYVHDSHELGSDVMNEDTERVLGKESNQRLLGALKRIGADVGVEKGYRLFKRERKERPFKKEWLDSNVLWMVGMEDENVRNQMIGSGFIRDLIFLKEQLPIDMIVWCWEHVAFEKNQMLACAYVEIVELSLQTTDFVTREIVDQVLLQFGADEELLQDTSPIDSDSEDVEVECNRYGIVSVASALSNLSPSLPFELRLHAILIVIKMAMDIEFGDDVLNTASATLSFLITPLTDSEIAELLTILTASIPSPALQLRVLTRLRIHPYQVAHFRQSLAKSFLQISPSAPISSFLTLLETSFPFNLPKKNISNQHSLALKYATSIFDIAIGKPPAADKNTTSEIVKMLRDIDSEILDGRAAFIMRTECKKVLQGVWIRLDYSIHEKGWMAKDGLDRFCAIYN